MTRFLLLFFIGAFGYSSLELLWCGYTHWTMFCLGGICLYILFITFSHLSHVPILTRAIIGGLIITLSEFFTGCVVNLFFKWNVWSYATKPFNLLGQICLPYTILWIFLSIPIAALCNALAKYI